MPIIERNKCRRLLWLWGSTKDYCAKLHREIDEYQDLIKSAGDLQSKPLTGMPFGGGTGDPTSRAAEKIIELQEIYAERIDEMVDDIRRRQDKARKVDLAMEGLSVFERAVIDHKYERQQKDFEIAKDLNYSEDGIRSVEKRAVDKIRRNIAAETV